MGVERVKKARLSTLRAEFESLKMKDGETIDDFLGKLNGLVSKAVTLGATIAESDMVGKLLDSMPDRFIQIVATIEQCYDVDSMKLGEAIGRLKAYEEQIKGKDDSSIKDSKLLFTRSQGKHKQQAGHRPKQGQNRNNYNGRGKSRGYGKPFRQDRGGQGSTSNDRKNQSKYKDRSQVKCCQCNELGRYASKYQKSKNKEEANIVQTEQVIKTLLLACCRSKQEDAIFLNEEKITPRKSEDEPSNKDIWYLDNGASNHMTGIKSHLSELNEDINGEVKFRRRFACEDKRERLNTSKLQ
ncbi:uncharacterized protein LOC143586673 [Bidens hawaiensis]|uniref:uncharacterized protein LOC143586673 n=1 Tax=Bidens hawaiensis TaxID=980011 RepID=UPI0040499E93